MYVRPEEAARILGISRATITRCKQLGAPVRYIGTCGRLYLVDPDALGEWMHQRGAEEQEATQNRRSAGLTVAQLRALRHRAG